MIAEADSFRKFPKYYRKSSRKTGLKNITLSFSGTTRVAIFSLLIFTPLARASVQDWAVSIVHILTLLALTTLLLDKTLKWDWKQIRTPLDKPIFALLTMSVISTIFSSHHSLSLRALTLFVNYLVIFYLTIHTIRTRARLRGIIYMIIGMGAFLIILGFLKQSGLNPFHWWEYADLSQNSYRMSSAFGNPDHLAGYMEMAALLTLGLLASGFRYLKSSVMITLAFLMTTGLIFSLSRGGWTGAFAGFSFMIVTLMMSRYFKQKKLLIYLVTGFLAVMMIVLTSTPVVERIRTLEQKDEMPSFSGRVIVWGGITEMILDYPLAGSGPGTFRHIFTRYQPPGMMSHFTMGHNDYLHFIAETGLLLIPIGVWLLIAFYRNGFRKFRHKSRMIRGIALGTMSGVTAILVHSIADFNLHIPANALVFTIFGAMIAGPVPRR